MPPPAADTMLSQQGHDNQFCGLVAATSNQRHDPGSLFLGVDVSHGASLNHGQAHAINRRATHQDACDGSKASSAARRPDVDRDL